MATVKHYRHVINHNLRETEKFDAENVQLNLSTRYFTSSISSFDRGFYLNLKQRNELLNNKHYLSNESLMKGINQLMDIYQIWKPKL